MSCQILPFPEELRPRLPTIVGNVDYRTLRERLEQIDSLLRLSGLECDFVQRSVERWPKATKRKEPQRAKGYANRETALAWGVLTHNLWVVARMKRVESATGRRRKAA
jgi:hypothetical protein